jgi:chitin disaccharide deacetylase
LIHSFHVKRLIINADDFGVTPGVNRAIVELNGAGALSSATLMATSGSFREAAHESVKRPSLGTGCHVTLVDGNPLLESEARKKLVTRPSGHFRESLGRFAWDLVRGAIPEAEIEGEAAAQIRRLQASGVTVTHVDTHKHAHVFPGVYRPLLRAARSCGVRAIRNPFEPDWSLAVTRGASGLRRMQVRMLRSMRTSFLESVRRAGLTTTDGAIGVLATGKLDAETLRAFLKAMPDGDWELCCHPGYVDAALEGVRTRLRQSREIERRALEEVIPNAAGFSLIHFGQLAMSAAAV